MGKEAAATGRPALSLANLIVAQLMQVVIATLERVGVNLRSSRF